MTGKEIKAVRYITPNMEHYSRNGYLGDISRHSDMSY